MGSDGDVSLNLLKAMMADFSRERDWDRFHSLRNLLLALVGKVGELSEIFQWKGEVPWGLPAGTTTRRSISARSSPTSSFTNICGVDLGKAAFCKVRLNAIKYPATAANDKNHEETTAKGSDALGANDDGKSIGRGRGF